MSRSIPTLFPYAYTSDTTTCLVVPRMQRPEYPPVNSHPSMRYGSSSVPEPPTTPFSRVNIESPSIITGVCGTYALASCGTHRNAKHDATSATSTTTEKDLTHHEDRPTISVGHEGRCDISRLPGGVAAALGENDYVARAGRRPAPVVVCPVLCGGNGGSTPVQLRVLTKTSSSSEGPPAYMTSDRSSKDDTVPSSTTTTPNGNSWATSVGYL